jgi:hypothetical protein
MPPDPMIRRHIYDRNISIMADKTLLLKNADLLCTMGPRDAGSWPVCSACRTPG